MQSLLNMNIRSLIICASLIGALAGFSAAAETDFIDASQLKIEKDARGISVRTNTNSGRFYMIFPRPDLNSMVGKVFDAKFINASNTVYFAESYSSFALAKSKPVLYTVRYGAFACLEGKTLTLTSFTIEESDEDGAHAKVVGVQSSSTSFRVADAVVSEVKHLKLFRSIQIQTP